MANIKSQKKRNLTNEKAHMRNRAYKSELHTAVRAVRDAAEAENGAEAIAAAHKACRLLDKAAGAGIIHKNQAANRKSGVMKLANSVATPEEIAGYKAPSTKKQTAKSGSKKAARKEERKAAYEKAAKDKEANRKATQKAQANAAKRKEEQAAAEKAAAAEAQAAE